MLRKLPETGAETPGLSAWWPENRVSYEVGAWCLMRKAHRRERETKNGKEKEKMTIFQMCSPKKQPYIIMSH